LLAGAAGVASLVLALAATGPVALASDHNSHKAASSHGFWVVITPGESFGEAARTSGGAVAATVRGMVRRAEAGKTVLVPEGTRHGVHNVRASVSELRAALSEARSLGHRANVRTAGVIPRTSPNEYPIRGEGCNQLGNGFASWCNMRFELDGAFCAPGGCETTDTLRAKVTVDPATKTSRVSYNSTYAYQPHDPNFSNIHFEWWVLCYRGEDDCGSDNTSDFFGNSSGTFFPTSTKDLHGDTVTHALTLRALFAPNGSYYADNAKTAGAFCDPVPPEPSNQCLYSLSLTKRV
jgi:hypothetical protein